MPIELRIQTGARAGVRESFDKPLIAVGRHPASDLRFDSHGDLDVSTRHGEIRELDGRYSIHDAVSTNGTFVNGVRVPPGESTELRDNDVIRFGADGPLVSVRIGAGINSDVRRPTAERVAIAVREQTHRLRIAVVVTVVVLGGLAGGIFYTSSRASAERDAEIKRLLATNDKINRDFQTRLQGDTVLTNSLQRHNDSLTSAVRDARNAAQAAAASQALEESHVLQRKFTEMGLPAVREANDAAVALIATDIGGQSFESTGFSVSASGRIVTNRHVVSDSTGVRASTIGVKFANTRVWRRAHLVKMYDDPTVDLALIQIDDAGAPFPAVHEIASEMDSPVGSSIATIGFPLGTDLPMGGSGSDAVAKTSLSVGTVSKSVPGLLQIDAFATHGSSGSPVFDAHGRVVGVVSGAPKEAGGRIVFAVPSTQIKELMRSAK